MKSRASFIILGLLGLIVVLTFIQAIHIPFSFITETSYLSEPYDKKGLIKGLLYLSTYFFSIAALLSILFIAKRWVAISLITLSSILFGVDLFLQFLGSSPNGITVAQTSTALNEVGRIADLLVYKKPLIYAVLAAFGLLIVSTFIHISIPENRKFSWIWGILLLGLAITSIGLLSAKIFSIKTQSYLAPIKTPLVLREYFFEYRTVSTRTLDATIKTSQAAEFKTIIWIIDESISGNYLSINGYPKATTPFLIALQTNPTMQNYGTVASLSNCSNTSNLLLRIGLTSALKQDFKTAKNSLPTIFQYAKQAGFATHLIDAQITPGELQNNLTAQDLKFIDYYTAFPRSIHPQDRDQALTHELSKLLKGAVTNKQFIVAVKWGAHWPYPLAYPKDQTIFTPAATESLTEMSNQNREIVTNSYLNAIHYSVDFFLKNLLAKPLSNEQLIFYTSDHGQSLFEQANSPLTHCHYSDKPQDLPVGEFKVPLIVFSQAAKTNFPKLEDRLYTQEQIFPSTLKLMGYSRDIYAAYGPTLMQGSTLNYTESFILDSNVRLKMPKEALQ